MCIFLHIHQVAERITNDVLAEGYDNGTFQRGQKETDADKLKTVNRIVGDIFIKVFESLKTDGAYQALLQDERECRIYDSMKPSMNYVTLKKVGRAAILEKTPANSSSLSPLGFWGSLDEEERQLPGYQDIEEGYNGACLGSWPSHWGPLESGNTIIRLVYPAYLDLCRVRRVILNTLLEKELSFGDFVGIPNWEHYTPSCREKHYKSDVVNGVLSLKPSEWRRRANISRFDLVDHDQPSLDYPHRGCADIFKKVFCAVYGKHSSDFSERRNSDSINKFGMLMALDCNAIWSQHLMHHRSYFFGNIFGNSFLDYKLTNEFTPKDLVILQCDHVHLDNIDTIGIATKLVILDCSKNFIKTIPNCIRNLNHLKVFNCSENIIEKIPDCIGDLRNLEDFDCSYNRIKSIPSSIGKCANLSDINFSDNKIETIPDELCEINGLRIFQCEGNPLTPAAAWNILLVRSHNPECRITMPSKVARVLEQLIASAKISRQATTDQVHILNLDVRNLSQNMNILNQNVRTLNQKQMTANKHLTAHDVIIENNAQKLTDVENEMQNLRSQQRTASAYIKDNHGRIEAIEEVLENAAQSNNNL